MSKDKQTKFIFVTGGVLSGLGKGITAASIAHTLKARGLRVNLQKCDPYLNVDAGTLNPAEHGECFVTADGAETDLDLGHYERFLDIELTNKSSIMSGRLLLNLIKDERDGKFLGQTVQVLPHFTNSIKDNIIKAGEGFDVHIVEIGGTVGDYESPAFIEAIREMSLQIGRENCLYVHVVYLPYLGASKEIKTKPAQNALKDLRSVGIIPDVLVARSEENSTDGVRAKLSLHGGVQKDAVVLLPNAATIYQVPLTIEEQGIGKLIAERLGFGDLKPDMKEWKDMVDRALSNPSETYRVGIVAKYLDNQDTYISVFEALRSAAWAEGVNLDLAWVDAEKLTDTKTLKEYDGLLVPGGFGERGIEGKVLAATHALDTKMPYLGLCLGLQVAVIAAARRAGLKDANSTEFAPKSTNPVIDTMHDQRGKENTGGTMRLGNYPCVLAEDSKSKELYGSKEIVERHRHRYECNNKYRDQYDKWGIEAVGLSPDKNLVEVIEGTDHPFFVASQFHPEFNSRPTRPHPLFVGFVASLKKTKK